MESKTAEKATNRRWIGYVFFAAFLVSLAIIGYGFYTIVQVSHTATRTIQGVSQEIAARSGISIWYVTGFVTLFSIVYFSAWANLYTTGKSALWNLAMPTFDPFYFFRNKAGKTIIGCHVAFFIAMGFASRNALAYKNCAETPGGLYHTDNSGFDPTYRVPLTPCTREQIQRILAGNTSSGPQMLTTEQVKQRGFFNESGFAQIWYASAEDGSYRFYDRGGVDSEGDTLQPVTHAIVKEWSRRQRSLLAQQQSTRAQQQQTQQRAQTQQELAADAERAQQQYETGAFQQALDSCRPVLAAEQGSESCRDIEHDASAKLSRQLVDKGQSELERGQLEDAARNAGRALRLDPANGQAKTLQTVAQNLISTNNR